MAVFARTEQELAPYWVVSVQEMMVYQGVIHMVAGNTADIPTFENPWPSPAPVLKKGDLGWACQGTQVEACRSWLAARSAQPITERDLQIILCTPCTVKKGT